MSLTLKIGSLAIRTLAKPIGNYIKRNAREHDTFRKICVSFAQRLHRVDMRMRLGLLQDRDVILRQNERQLARDAVADEAKRKKAEAQIDVAEGAATATNNAKDRSNEKSSKPAKKLPTIRPLSEGKAIESGANFISETFLFVVAGGLIILERWWANRKETNRREDVAERLVSLETDEQDLKSTISALEAQIQDLRSKENDTAIAAQDNGTAPGGKASGHQINTQSLSSRRSR